VITNPAGNRVVKIINKAYLKLIGNGRVVVDAQGEAQQKNEYSGFWGRDEREKREAL
jgi:hypothetical protein